MTLDVAALQLLLILRLIDAPLEVGKSQPECCLRRIDAARMQSRKASFLPVAVPLQSKSLERFECPHVVETVR